MIEPKPQQDIAEAEIEPLKAETLHAILLACEKEMIESALAQSHGRILGPAGAAAKLGIPDSTLEAKIRRMGIDRFRFKPR
jgi:formate hydrogenlyase transcriptional activator